MTKTTDFTKANKTSVLVVGGSLVGLSMATFLAKKGIETVVVERHPGSSPHPRATGFTPRTMELFRTVGIDKEISQTPPKFRLQRARVESLAGKWFEESEWTPGDKQFSDIEYSPYRGAAIAQDRLEPIIHDKAVKLGAEVRISTELIDFKQDSTGVTALLRNREDGKEYTLRADYLVAADGNRSSIREKLGIGRSGQGHIRTMRSILFRAPLDKYLESGVRQFDIDQPELNAFLTTYGDGRWVLMFNDDIERDEINLRDAIQKALGRSDLDIEMITTGRWDLSALIADSFSSGRIFLAGDAAHTLPPTRGGFGANTGIHDAYNLAWKLTSVLSGESTTQLLDTYDAERRPIAWLRHDQTFARPDYKSHANDTESSVHIIDDDAIEFGQLYRSASVIGTNAKLPSALRMEQWAGQPGTRAPHLWFTKDGEPMTTLDLFGDGWVLLTEDKRWLTHAESIGHHLGVRLECHQIGTDSVALDPEVFRKTFGIGYTGATLIRPDGYIAWRTADMPVDPYNALSEVLCTVMRQGGFTMFRSQDSPQHSFTQGQNQFHHGGYFDRDFREESINSGRLQFFSNKRTSGDIGDKRFFRRGDIKIVLLKLIQKQPRHGYELIKELEEKFKGFYSPSPGSVYPTLQMLEEQDLISVTKDGRKKVYHLTEEGQTFLGEHQNEDPIVSRINMFEEMDMNLDEMQKLRSDIQSLFDDFFAIGRQAMVNPEKKEQLQQLLKKTRTELSTISDDNEKNTEKR